jgi:hypothetical protein
MQNMLTKSGLILLLAGAILWIPALVRAGDPLLPDVPVAQRRVSESQSCVEPTAEMRRNHMKYILHQRDETTHNGIRTSKYSLEECINCHVSQAPDAPRASSDKHFCNSCHTYAAVNIDCFECHADRPVATSGKLSMTTASLTAHAQTDETPVALPPGNNLVMATKGINHD